MAEGDMGVPYSFHGDRYTTYTARHEAYVARCLDGGEQPNTRSTHRADLDPDYQAYRHACLSAGQEPISRIGLLLKMPGRPKAAPQGSAPANAGRAHRLVGLSFIFLTGAAAALISAYVATRSHGGA